MKKTDYFKIGISNLGKDNSNYIKKTKSTSTNRNNSKNNQPQSSNTSTIILDEINLQIIEQVINDPDIKSADISKNLNIPLSTIQRRRHVLETLSVFNKKYELDFSKFNLRVADIMLGVSNGKVNEVLSEIQKKYNKRIIDSAIRIGDPNINLTFKMIYKTASDIFNILENVRGIPNVDTLTWSEIVLKEMNNQLSIKDMINPK